ncbi:hypothetical protein D3C85_1250080 [compost metagenome]
MTRTLPACCATPRVHRPSASMATMPTCACRLPVRRKRPRCCAGAASGSFRTAVRPRPIFSSCRSGWWAICARTCARPSRTNGFARSWSRPSACPSRRARWRCSRTRRRWWSSASTGAWRPMAHGSCACPRRTSARRWACPRWSSTRPMAGRASRTSWRSCPAPTRARRIVAISSRRRSCSGCSQLRTGTPRTSA